jgi:hypothetical protein
MLITSQHSFEERGNDAYWTPPEATRALLQLEDLPKHVIDPACGTGAILDVLSPHGHIVYGQDIVDYGWPGTVLQDYLTDDWGSRDHAIVTNPPFKLANQFIRKALADGVRYHAWLLRMNFVESLGRLPMFRGNPPARVHISSRRLPMMHRHGWTGKKAGSNTCHAWFIWDQDSSDRGQMFWFDWKEFA